MNRVSTGARAGGRGKKRLVDLRLPKCENGRISYFRVHRLFYNL